MKHYPKEFELIINDIIQNETVQKMKQFKQHYNTSCFEHCLHVSYFNYILCKKLHLNYTAAARAGMLHDLFLYDWRERQPDRKGLHAFTHPQSALENSKKIFELSTLEEDIILKHMWPVTFKLPKYPESYIITLTDKFSAIYESCKYYNYYLKKINFKKIPQAIYTLLFII